MADCIGIGRTWINRLLRGMEYQPGTGCWLWKKAISSGYGVVHIRRLANNKSIPVHRLCYQLAYGSIDDSLHVHHRVEEPIKCCGRACGNPEHLLAVTPRDHIVDLTPGSASYVAAHRDHCAAGHPYTVATTRISSEGYRQCRVCDRIAAQIRRAARRAAEGREYRKWPKDKLKTVCKNGHSLEDPANIYITPGTGYRACRGCRQMGLDRSRKKHSS